MKRKQVIIRKMGQNLRQSMVVGPETKDHQGPRSEAPYQAFMRFLWTNSRSRN